jgi:hypothetical protein
MTAPSRRAFLRASAGGMASVLFAGHAASAADAIETAPPPRRVDVLPTDLTPRDTLFLTWQRDPTTTITAQWIGTGTEAPTSARVALREGEEWKTAKVETKPFGPTDAKVFRCEFTGLTPGTEYVLQLGKGPLTHRFRTMPAKANDTFTWVSGGDCGTGAAAVRTNQIAAKQEPYFALVGGDLGYDNGSSAKTAIQFVQNYAKHMIDPKGRLIPLVTCIGNHEVRGGYKGKRADATYYLPLFDGLYKESTYNALDFGDYLSLVLLDTGHVSPIGGDQTDWLDSALAEREGRPHLFVANHVPAYPSYRAPEGFANLFGTGEANRLHWCPLFEKYRVDAVLEHHDHTFKRTHPLTGGLVDKYGVPYLGDGSWGMLRAPNAPEKRPYLAKVAKAYHVTVHRFEGDQRYHVALDDTGRVADVYGTTGKRPAKRG